MAWRSLHPNHAIERVRLIFRFVDPLPNKLVRRLGAEVEDHREKLGFQSKNSHRGRQFNIGLEGVSVEPSSEELSRWDIRRTSVADTVIETLAVESGSVTYEAADYSGWQTFTERFEVVAMPSLRGAMEAVDLGIVILEYVDRFIFDGESTDAAPTEIFDGIENLIHADALNGTKLWHLHRGWFENIDDIELLINQNIDAQDAEIPQKEKIRSLQIYTKTELRQIPQGVDFSDVKQHLDTMHSRSKEVFASLLTVEMRAAIGI